MRVMFQISQNFVLDFRFGYIAKDNHQIKNLNWPYFVEAYKVFLETHLFVIALAGNSTAFFQEMAQRRN